MSDHGTPGGTGTSEPAPIATLETGDDEGGRYAAHLGVAARHPVRVERLVGLCFLLSILATIVLGWDYIQRGSPVVEGISLFVLFTAMGVGMAAWGKYLMPRGPFVEQREVLTSERNQKLFAETFKRGQVAIEGRRSFLLKLLLLATGAMGVILLFPLRSLTGREPTADSTLYKTGWFKGSKLLREDGTPVHSDDLEVGGSLTVFPEGSTDPANDQTMLIRPSTIPVGPPDKLHWSPVGYLAFSKVCTHAGCPVGQYEAQYQKLLCPCHESTFNVLDGAAVVFGPAPRPLPQLPLTLDSNGFLVAASTYGVPIGPGFWYRDGQQ